MFPIMFFMWLILPWDPEILFGLGLLPLMFSFLVLKIAYFYSKLSAVSPFSWRFWLKTSLLCAFPSNDVLVLPINGLYENIF